MDGYKKSLNSSASVLLFLGAIGLIFCLFSVFKLFVMYGHYGTLLESASVSCFQYEYPNKKTASMIISEVGATVPETPRDCPEIVLKLIDLKNVYLFVFYLFAAFCVVVAIIAIGQKLTIKQIKK